MVVLPVHRGLGLVVLLLAIWLCPPAHSSESSFLPWSLRDRYTFDGAGGSFQFDVKTGEWRVDITGAGSVLQDVQAEVVFSDGRRILLSGLHQLREERDAASESYGEGQSFRSVFETADGLAIRYGVTRFRDRPFLLLRMSLENNGTLPVEVASFRPAIFARSNAQRGAHAPTLVTARSDRRGRYPILGAQTRVCLVTSLYTSARGVLGIGVLETGQAHSTVQISSSNNSLVGAVESRFEPSIRVDPGESLDADPVWISYLLTDPRKVDEYFAWTQSAIPGASRGEELPANWITVKGVTSAKALYDAVSAWESETITHALVPSDWAREPGSLKGRWPDYPHEMVEVSRELVRRGVTPGIYVDPLANDTEEARWINPLKSAERARAVRRMKSIVRAGFRFFVVRESAIPDEALKAFNITRLQADRAAFEIMSDATGGLPVFPESTLKLGSDVGEWEGLLESMRWYEPFNVVAPPVEFHLEGQEKLSSELMSAIGRFPGPIEITGMPQGKTRRQLSLVFETTAPDKLDPVPKGSREKRRRARSSRLR